MSTFTEPVNRAYLEHGHVAHILPWAASLNDNAEAALCGLTPVLFSGWFGSGTQDEIELLAELPLCLNCERARRRPTVIRARKGT